MDKEKEVTLKQALKKSSDSCLQPRYLVFYFKYRIIPHAAAGISPSELLLMNLCLRSYLDLLHLNFSTLVKGKREQQKDCHEQHYHPHDFNKGETVYVTV